MDTFTNLASIPVDLLRGDYISAGLDLVGAIPFVGEMADVAKTARTADRIIDGVKAADKVVDGVRFADRVHDTAKSADSIVDGMKAAEKATDAFRTADTAVDGVKTGSNIGELARPYPKERVPDEVNEYLTGLLQDGQTIQVYSAPSFEQISLMSRQEAVEFASITVGDRNYILRGNSKGTNISQDMLDDMIQNKGILNCHSHPYIGDVQPSQSDLRLAEILNHQKEFRIVTPDGLQATYTKDGIISVENIARNISKEDISKYLELFGG